MAMLPQVSVHRFCCAPFTNVHSYRRIVGDELIEEILELACDLKGIRVCHINSTGYGGGVAELLSRHVPLARALGIDADWRLIQGTPEFFRVTKAIHNALQGAPYTLSDADRAIYRDVNRASAEMLETTYDVFFVHDPQPAAFRDFARAKSSAKWIWRCHIDTSAPNRSVSDFILPFVRDYDVQVFTMREFMLPGLDAQRTIVIAPAIDPLSTKNVELPPDLCRQVVANAGLSLKRPIVLQVSRFDPWKDPMGVIEAYRRAKREMPGVQLALVGAIAGDDPEGWQLLSRVQQAASADADIYIFTNLEGVGSMEVNAFQRACDVVIQKSLREGFGLVVSEAFWKERAVIAGRAGGIAMQYPAEYARYLVDNVDDCAERIVELLGDASRRHRFGEAAREHIRTRYLLPRLLRDELKLVRSVLAASPVRASAAVV